MPAQTELVRSIRVASPCSQSWDAMEGDDRCRFCTACGQNVYNLSALTETEVENLVREKEGKLCVRFYRRRDGTVLTRNCPVGMRAMRRSLLWQCGALAAFFALIPGVGAAAQGARWKEWALWDREPFYGFALRWGIRHPIVVGAMAVPTPPPNP